MPSPQNRKRHQISHIASHSFGKQKNVVRSDTHGYSYPSCDPTLYGAWKFFSPFGSCSAYTIVSQQYFVVIVLYQLKIELQYP